MPVAIHIPTPLRPFTDKLDTVQASGATVGEVLNDLTTKYAGLKQHLYSPDGKLRSFVNIYVGDEDIRYLQKEQTPVADGQTLSIIPSVAGGAGAAAPAAALPALDGEEIKRYSRHLILSEVGMEGQQKLKAAKVLCIGAGGLGSPVGDVSGRGRRRHASASSTSTRWTSATCSARSCTAPLTSAARSWPRRRTCCSASTRT